MRRFMPVVKGIGGITMAIVTFKREVDTASVGAYASYTLCDNGIAIYEDSEGRHVVAVMDIDVLSLFCTFGKMSPAVQCQIISMMSNA